MSASNDNFFVAKDNEILPEEFAIAAEGLEVFPERFECQ